MGNDRNAKRVYVGESMGMGIRLVARLRKSWVDYLQKIGLNIGQAERRLYDRNEW